MSNTGKRAFDIIFAFISLLVLSPLFAAISAAIYIAMGRPILFRQERPGLRGRPFVIYKFRTMVEGEDEDEGRLTPLGKLLRRSSLDELPELINVIRGEMSLVGPRPLLMEYLPLYTPEQRRRHEVRPGITGWAQVNGRNVISWEERFKLDVWYVDNHTFCLDIKILLVTLLRVIRQEGISQRGRATMEKFTGNKFTGAGKTDD